MNDAIDFTVWLREEIRGYWKDHGTKILGWMMTVYGTVQVILGAISASPHFETLVTPRQFAVLAVANSVLGALTIRRGMTNTRAAAP